jgi:hypothetical protein
MQPFTGLTLSPALESYDWVNSPAQFLEQLSAHLWATHQMDTFRAASEIYVGKFHATLKPAPLPVPRAGVVVIGEGVAQPPAYRLFVKLQRAGTLFTQAKPADGLNALHAVLKERAQLHPAPYAHWCLDGGPPPTLEGFATVSYHQLEPVRSALTAQMLTGYQASHFDPEALRTMLARTTFDSLGLKPSGNPTLDHFSLSLFTEGSGTQIYSTTFIQWAAREALRRAQPLTLYAHFSPRQRERSMDELLAGTHATTTPETDVLGSLIDADMGAYYTWLNQQRLPEAAQSRFLVWFENHTQAVAIGPAFEHGRVDNSPIDIAALARQVL